jgi:hypothetical protein
MHGHKDGMSTVMRLTMLIFALLASAGNAAGTQPAPDGETLRLTPSIRPILPSAHTFRFEPRADITTEELDLLGPYLKGKPLYDEDQKALGSAMRHLREVN